MSGDYGHFASDEFSAWLVPCAWEHYLFTGDEALARELWPAVDRDLRYLASRMGDDGLFAQRFETSKHAMRMECGDVRKRVYQNVIFWMCWRDGAKLARALGHSTRADGKKPLTIDLRTVVGAPDVRYLRLSGDGLAKFGDGKRWGFRFANIRVNFTVR